MSLRKKILAALVIVVASYLGFTYYTLKQLIAPSFGALQTKIAEGNLTRAQESIETLLEHTDIILREWSSWDDTHRFARGEFDDFTRVNLDQYLFVDADMDLALFFDTQGEMLWGHGYDRKNARMIPASEIVSIELRLGHPLLSHDDPEDSLRGLISTALVPMIVASRPILTGEAKGPVAGTVLFGKFLDESRLRALRRQTGVEFNVDPTHTAASETDRAVLAELTRTNAPSKQVETEDSVLSYAILSDIDGEPSLVLRARTPRDVSAAGLNAVQLALVMVVVGGGVFIAALWVLLHWLIVRPVSELTQHISGIRSSGDLQQRIGLARSDEIGVLASQFDALADELHTTQQRMTEARDEALEVSRLKSEFLARMSHEIRTPMNGVVGMAELLIGTPLDAKQTQFARTIGHSADSLLTIINDILDFSKLEAGRVELEQRDFRLRELAEEVCMLFAGAAHAKGLELVCLIPPDLDMICRGDSNRLRQILANLVGNAVKFTRRGEVALALSIEEEHEEGCTVRFEIRDTGIGISAENQARIFESFTQADVSTTREYGGTGLGLAISMQLVDLMGGRLRIDSVPNRGSSFWFVVSLERSGIAPDAWRQSIPALRGKRVLVVDDNETNRGILRHQVALWEMHCTPAEGGREALAALRVATADDDPFDVILLDMHMPEMDGLEVARTISADPTIADAPVLMLSSALAAGDVAERERAGIRDFLVKPVRQSDLFDAIVEALGTDVRRSRGEASTHETPAAREHAHAALGARVLLAEDNPVNQDVAREMLEALGCRVDLATNGVEAIAALDQCAYEIVFMDCQMPVMDGFEATEEIRRRESQQPSAGRTPIIALTAIAVEDDGENRIPTTMDDYLGKPFRQNQLYDVLTRWLPRDRAGAEPADEAAAAAPTEVTGEPPLDLTALDTIRSLQSETNPHLLANVAVAYWRSSNDLVADLGEAVEQGDAQTVFQCAHSLKSGSGNVGAHVLAQMCEELELMGRSGDLEEAKDRYERIVDEHRRVLAALTAAVPFTPTR